jgi:hypothetical protein
MKPLLNDTVTGTVLGPDGVPLLRPTTILTAEEAELLRQYKTLLLRHGMREALYCNTCFDGALHDGMKAFVRDSEIMIECRHRRLYYLGQSF